MVTEQLDPNAAGTHAEMDPDPVRANYLNVIGVNDATENVNVDTATWEKDTYNLDDSSGSGTISQIELFVRLFGSTVAGEAAEYVLITNSQEDTAPATTDLPLLPTNLSKVYTTNPITSNAWTWAEIDALEAGVRLYNAGGALCPVGILRLYVMVTYLPYIAGNMANKMAGEGLI